jgi:prolyl oligopeptidase PreP (S9A serine peptidase family)
MLQVYAGEKTDVAVNGYVSNHRGVYLEWRTRSTGFYSSIKQLRKLTAQADSPWVPLDQLPDDAELSQFADRLLISLRTDWRGFAGGSLLDVSTAELMELGADKVTLRLPALTSRQEGLTSQPSSRRT